MNYIIQVTDDMYFSGWDGVLGNLKYTSDVNSAYRMRRTVAVSTLNKIFNDYPDAMVLKVS